MGAGGYPNNDSGLEKTEIYKLNYEDIGLGLLTAICSIGVTCLWSYHIYQFKKGASDNAKLSQEFRQHDLDRNGSLDKNELELMLRAYSLTKKVEEKR